MKTEIIIRMLFFSLPMLYCGYEFAWKLTGTKWFFMTVFFAVPFAKSLVDFQRTYDGIKKPKNYCIECIITFQKP